jgi:hypothetical protein
MSIPMDVLNHTTKAIQQREAIMPEITKAQALPDSERDNFDQIKDNIRFILVKTFEFYKERISVGYIMSPADTKQIMDIYEKIDKICRLEDGRPTDVYDFKMLTLQEIRQQLDSPQLDPFKEIIDIELSKDRLE